MALEIVDVRNTVRERADGRDRPRQSGESQIIVSKDTANRLVVGCEDVTRTKDWCLPADLGNIILRVVSGCSGQRDSRTSCERVASIPHQGHRSMGEVSDAAATENRSYGVAVSWVFESLCSILAFVSRVLLGVSYRDEIEKVPS